MQCESTVESAESARAQSLEGAQYTTRAQFESAESRVQTREYRECENEECVRMQNTRVQSRGYRECQNAESRVQSESTKTRVQRLRESKVESAEIVNAESVSTVREHSGESTESKVQRVQGRRVERRKHSAR